MDTLNKKQYQVIGAFFVLIIISLFHNLGVQPLYLEEPRRALIALEMLFNDNIWVPKEFNILYFKKPPVWNWMILLAFKLFGQNEFAVRFFSALSFIGMAGILYALSKRYVNKTFALWNSLFFLISVDIYFHFSQLGEIDLFYSLICFGSFALFFHFYTLERYYLMYLSVYTLGAIGFLTKGFPSVAFIGLTLLGFLGYQHKLKRLFHPGHFIAAGVFLCLIFLYYWKYNQYEDAVGFVKVLWSRSSNRTVINHDIIGLKFTRHLISFPIETIKNILPIGLMIPLFFYKKSIKLIKENSFIIFCLIVFISNYWVYLISPGSKQRYIYMLLPLAISCCTWLYFHKDKIAHWISTYWLVCQFIVFGIYLTGAVSLFFMLDTLKVEHLFLKSTIILFSYLGLLTFFIIKKQWRLYTFVFSFILFRFILNTILMPHRAIESRPACNKEDARKIANMVSDQELYMFKKRPSRSTIYYLELFRQETLEYSNQINEGRYYLMHEKDITPVVDTIYRFDDKYNKGDYYFLCSPKPIE